MDLTNMETLRALLAKYDFRFSKSLGQNFLVRSWVPERIVDAAGIDRTKGVLEIGPGVGVLTRYLSANASKVVAVELDKRLMPILSETLRDCPNVNVIHRDILKCDLSQIIPEEFDGLEPVVCANLPYQVTTPVLTKVLKSGLFSAATVMVQKEVAQRMCAKPGTAEYGAFTVFTQYYSNAHICFDVPPDCFQPRPKVTSAVIKLKQIVPPAGLVDEQLFFSIVRAAFSQRRKTLLNALTPLLSPRLERTQILCGLTESGFDSAIRGEVLGIREFVQLTNYYAERLK